MRDIKLCVIILLGIILLNCGPNKFLWQGQYTSIQTVKEPKEDFLVDDYIVVAYDLFENTKDVSIPYKFVVLKEEEQVAEFFLTDRPSVNYMNTLLKEGKDIYDISDMMQEGKYYLEEIGPRCEDAHDYLAKSKEYVTYKSYNTKPSYSYVKSDVVTVLLGGVVKSD
ncbi:hypothetical protein AMJ74_02275 [candidate division WOR_3 bacterium SM1_77]|uniref:Uncharacterized protein n=1 Tax=candidate division WOR_3 bacterium SM1_77 TaxID=1703778 RepID=A0A0S8K2D6_UNCW3|nr:MAG: hypothetical protein AMJ74_02275 [candidate division WOR_3 bacterium SM1_77]